MRKQSFFRAGCRKSITTISLLFTGLFGAMAQSNTSFDRDSIPIGGTFSTAFGVGALSVNTGNSNTANGYQSLFSNTTGNSNTANGYQALKSSTTGNLNTAVGYQVLTSNTGGNNNTGIGFAALYSNISGVKNTAIGEGSLYSNSTGLLNTAIGVSSLFSNTYGSYNTAIGYRSLYLNLSGDFNTSIGYNALYSNKSGERNTVNGYRSLYSNISGNDNVAIGDSAGFLSTGSYNVYIGKRAGYYESGNNKLYIANDSNQTMIYGDMTTGQLLVGNRQPAGYTFKGTRTLNVLGGILTDSIRVAPSVEWADYVFADEYYLKPLEEVGNFIKINKHLPNVPSAEEVATNGIELASMDAKLLEKIEELTLYILKQQKQIDAQQNTNELLKKQIELQKANNELMQQNFDELKKMIIKTK